MNGAAGLDVQYSRTMIVVREGAQQLPVGDGQRRLVPNAQVGGRGRPQPGEDRSRAMPHVLTAAHGQGHAVVIAVHGDGSRHRIFVGGRRLAGTARGSTEDFLDGQASLLRAHVPGLDLTAAAPLTGTGTPKLSAFLHAAPALALVTGIRAPRGNQATAAFQNLDRLIGAVGNRRYALVFVAEPLGAADLDEAIDQCRRLRSEVHVLARRGVQETEQQGTSSTSSAQEDAGQASDVPGYLMSVVQFANLAGMVIPGAGEITTQIKSAVSLIATLTGIPAEPTATIQTTVNESRTRGWSADLLNANAEACEQLLQCHIDRLQAARSSGWWRNAITSPRPRRPTPMPSSPRSFERSCSATRSRPGSTGRRGAAAGRTRARPTARPRKPPSAGWASSRVPPRRPTSCCARTVPPG